MTFARAPHHYLFAALPLLAACTATPSTSEAESVGTTEAALTTGADPCAVGFTPNATIDISKPATHDHYFRPGSYINSICPAHGKDRPMTVVDFEVGTQPKIFNSWSFAAFGDFATPASKLACELLTMEGQLFFYTGDHVWKGVSHQIRHGLWVQDNLFVGHCDTSHPAFVEDIVTLQSGRYRMHVTAATNPNLDSDFVGVTVDGSSSGPSHNP